MFSEGFLWALFKLEISMPPRRAIVIFLTISSCMSNMSSLTRSYLLLQMTFPSGVSESSTEILNLSPTALMLPETI